MKKLLFKTLLIISLTATQASSALSTFDTAKDTVSNCYSSKIGFGVVAVIAGYAAGTFIYKAYKCYLENKIINETVDALFLSLTLNSTLAKLPKEEQEKAFRKKAWLISMRKRIISQLQQQKTLSKEHKAALNKALNNAYLAFNIVDLFSKNPYEQDYVNASFLDTMIENNIINSILLQFKPNAECNQEELTKKTRTRSKE
ncbi:MAG: hypothetical protein RQ875_14390 [Vicingaceae bacterium]|nr:hypothetical protein [Vicingaceae bacterium]